MEGENRVGSNEGNEGNELREKDELGTGFRKSSAKRNHIDILKIGKKNSIKCRPNQNVLAFCFFLFVFKIVFYFFLCV